MGQLYMNQIEHEFWELEIAEAARMLGQECKLYQIDNIDQDLNRDTKINYKEPVDINILFESNPKPILKKMGWMTEDDDLPYVVYLTSLDDSYNRVVIEKYVKISVPNNLGEVTFIVSDVQGSKINPLFWICKLVPYRYNIVNSSVNISSSEYKGASIVDSGDSIKDTESDISALEGSKLPDDSSNEDSNSIDNSTSSNYKYFKRRN